MVIAVSLVGSSVDAKTVSKKKKKHNTTQTVVKKKSSKKSNKAKNTTKINTIKKENSLKQESLPDNIKPKTNDLNESNTADMDDNKMNNTVNADDNNIDPWKRFKKFYFGISYGLGMSNYTNVEHGKVIFSMDAGVIAGYGLNDHIFIESGLKYSWKGYDIHEKVNRDHYYSSMDNHELLIPLKIGAMANGFFASIGPYFSFSVGGKLSQNRIISGYPNKTESKLSKMDAFNDFVLGMELGVGYRRNAGEFFFIYQRGLTKIFEKLKSYEQGFYLGYGLIF